MEFVKHIFIEKIQIPVSCLVEILFIEGKCFFILLETLGRFFSLFCLQQRKLGVKKVLLYIIKCI